MKLKPADPNLFFSRQDTEDPRLGELVFRSEENLPAAATHIFGWPDDEGIRLNGGRVGAAEAPDRIRKYLYKMTPALDASRTPVVIDRGNLATDIPLRGRHEAGRELVASVLLGGGRTLSFGGGHDYGYADGAGFLDTFGNADARPLVVNFDAHLDVRPMLEHPHSGTPFRRLLEQYRGKFDFVEIGLQPQCNSRAHARWARSEGAQLWMMSEVDEPGRMVDKIAALASNSGDKRPLWISVDIDAITSEAAPGCSQSWAWGLSVATVVAGLRALYRQFDTKAFSIYEVSPPLDRDDHTSKLAALLAHSFLFHGGDA